jgi:hypothetical protein
MLGYKKYIALILFFPLNSYADNIPQDTTEYKIDPTRLAIIGGSIAASYTTVYLIFLKDGWWPGGKYAQGFHFEKIHNDFGYSSNMDKFGHFYAGAVFGELFTMSYDWVGMSPFASTLWAGITLGVTQIAVELKDGFAPYGYSIYDAMAGTLGGFYAMGKRFIPVMQYVDYKFSYFPNSSVYWDDIRNSGGEIMGGKLTGGDGVFVDDYYGGNQVHWLSFKVAKMLPSGTKDYYPQWLAWAFGWGIDEGQYTRKFGDSRYEFYFSPDYDFEAIIRPQKIWSKNVVKVLNFIKFPTPAVRFGRDPKFFPLHPWYGFAVRLSG